MKISVLSASIVRLKDDKKKKREMKGTGANSVTTSHSNENLWIGEL